MSLSNTNQMKNTSDYSFCLKPNYEEIKLKCDCRIDQLLNELTDVIRRRDHAEMMMITE